MIIEANFLPGSDLLEEPIGLAYIASLLKKNNYSVNIQDFNIDDLDKQTLNDYILTEKPSVICLGFTTLQAEHAFKLCRFIKEKFPDIFIVTCGIHPTFKPRQTLTYSKADFAVIGEEEQTVLELVNALKNKTDCSHIKGIAYKKNGNIIINKPRELIKDLDSLPFPAYNLLKWRSYQTNIHGKYANKRAFNVIAARGCTFKCDFCVGSAAYGNTLRLRSVDNVLDEIKWIIKNFGIDCIHFEDNDFLMKPKKWLIDFCNKIKQKNMKFNWLFQTRVDSVINKREILVVIKKAGCIGLELGVESGDQYVLDKIKKQITVEQIRLAGKILKKADINAFHLMLCYYCGENLDSAYKSAKILYELENDCDLNSEFIPIKESIRLHGDVPLMTHQTLASPGTPFSKEISDDSSVNINENKNFTTDNITFIPHELLNDIPLKNSRINKRILDFIKDYENNIKEYSALGFYLQDSLIQQNFIDFDSYSKFLLDLWKNSNGENNVTDIIKIIKASAPKHAVDIERLTVSGLMILSILRVIKSKIARFG